MAKTEWKHKRRDRKNEWLTAADLYDFVSACYSGLDQPRDGIRLKADETYQESFEDLVARINKNAIYTNIHDSQN